MPNYGFINRFFALRVWIYYKEYEIVLNISHNFFCILGRLFLYPGHVNGNFFNFVEKICLSSIPGIQRFM